MKNWLTCCFVLFLSFAFGQKTIELNDKYFGTYKGEIPSYQLDSGSELFQVDSTIIRVRIDKSTIEITIGKNRLTGSYKVMFEAKKYFLLDCHMTGQLAGERIVVYKKGRKIARDGLYPQPNTFLYKEN